MSTPNLVGYPADIVHSIIHKKCGYLRGTSKYEYENLYLSHERTERVSAGLARPDNGAGPETPVSNVNYFVRFTGPRNGLSTCQSSPALLSAGVMDRRLGRQAR